MSLLRITAGYLLPVSSPAIANGALLVGEDGRIAALGPDDAVPRPAGATVRILSEAVLLPGFVNAHTHLELTVLGGRVNDREFFDWIQHIRRRKGELGADEVQESARRGLCEAWRHGITTVADTGDTGAAARTLADLGGRGIAYQEIFGPHPAQVDQSMAELAAAVERLREEVASDAVRIGVSPHAPYSVSGPLFSRVARFAKREELPIAVHLAESKEESELVREGAGPFAASWRERGIPGISPARSPVAYLHGLGVLEASPLTIHAVQTDAEDAELLASHGCSVALCPRSNMRHGHGTPPVTTFLEAKIPCAVGTDSVASVASLDLLQDARIVGRLGDLTPTHTVRLLTLDGAKAIGMDEEIGSLEVGKWADLCAVRVPTGGLWEQREDSVAERVLAASAGDILLTCLGGRLVHEALTEADDLVTPQRPGEGRS